MTEIIRSVLEKVPEIREIGGNHSKLMRIDKDYALAVQEAEEHWLSTANKVLSEIMQEIRNRVTDENTTVTELVKALDTISAKWNLAMGKPTSFGFNVKAEIEIPADNDDLDKRIAEIEKHMIISSPPHYQIPRDEENVKEIIPLIPSQGKERHPHPEDSFQGEKENE